MAHRFTEQQYDFIRKVAPGRYNDEIRDLFNRKFGTDLTADKIKNAKVRIKVKSGVSRKKPDPNAGLFTKEQKDFIKKNVKGLYSYELADLVNKTFGLSVTAEQIQTYKTNHGLKNGMDGRFSKDHKPWNKGMKGLDIGGKETQFKKGQVPLNYRPIGSERVDNKDGYILIKVQDHGTWPERWRHKHQVVWEKYNKRKVPKNHVIIFADSNKENFDIDNLLLVKRSELVRMNQQDLFSDDPELTKAGLLLVRLGIKITDYEIYGGDRKKFKKYLEQAKRNGLTEQGFVGRLRRGWSLQDAVNKPKYSRNAQKRKEIVSDGSKTSGD